jgi:DNA-binding NarL/FixJ family response regulator
MEREAEIFILEDDEQDRELIEEKLIKEGLHPHFLYSRSTELLSMLKGKPYVLAMDFYLGGENLIDDEIIKRAREACPDCYNIIMSGQDSKKTFIQLINAKADYYVDKTSSLEWLDELAAAIKEGRKEIEKRIIANEERKKIEEELEEIRRKLNERIKKRETQNDGRAY